MAHEDGDIGARVRAARSYADLSQQGLADAIGVERRIVGYIEANEPRHELTVPEAQRIAAATGVPLTFLLNGWAAPPELIDRVEALERSVRTGLVDRDLLAREVEGLSERIEKRLATYARRALQQDRRRQPGEGRPREEGGSPR